LADDPPVVWLFWLAFTVFACGSAWAIHAYGGPSFWPGLLGNFGASLAAFVLALSWDHDMERRRATRESDSHQADRRLEAEAMEDRLVTEARRRLEPVSEELRRNKASLAMLATEFASGTPAPGRILHPELLDGAWAANATSLTQILADYELVSKLASTYGRIEELRWRLRQRTAFMATAPGLAAALDGMTKPLIDELVVEVTDILERVATQIDQPTIQQLGVISSDAATVVGRVVVGV
jgi:hypothetical protein